MSLADDLNAIRHHITRTNDQISTYRSRIKDHTKGGLPAGGDGTGRRSSNAPPLPRLDPEDRAIARELDDLKQWAGTARNLLENIDRIVTARITPAEPLPDPDPYTCSVLVCGVEVGDRFGPDRRRYGWGHRLCESCYRHGLRNDGVLPPWRKDGSLMRGFVRKGNTIVKEQT